MTPSFLLKMFEETIPILHFEKDPKRTNALEEMEIIKVTTSNPKLNIMQYITKYNYLRIRRRPARTCTEDVLIGMKGLYV